MSKIKSLLPDDFDGFDDLFQTYVAEMDNEEREARHAAREAGVAAKCPYKAGSLKALYWWSEQGRIRGGQ